MLLAYETGVVTGPYPQYTLAERLRLELRNPLSRVDGLAIHSNTIMGPFLNSLTGTTGRFRTYKGCV